MRICKRGRLAAAAVSAAALWVPTTQSFAQLAAFPGAEGYGALATGGRGGSVYVVTNLNNSGAGSFEDAVSHSNRIVVFAVSGYIVANAPITISSNVTVLGQTAPGQGIGIQGQEVSLSDKTNDIVQYMHFRQGSGGSSTEDSLNFGDGTNMIFDHDSIEYGLFNNIDASGATGVGNDTLQNCIIADPIKGQQFNMHLEANTASFPNTMTVVNNVFTNAHNRNPLAKGNLQYVNNVVYDFQAGYTVASTGGNFTQDIINNYFITGPATTSPSDAFFQMDTNIKVFASGNMLDSNKDGALNGSALAVSGVTTLTTPGMPGTSALPTLSTAAAYAFDIAHSGASLSYDTVDSQVISQVQSLGTQGTIYNTQNGTGLSNGGFGTITGGTSPVSTAGDGIPDSWAITHGLSITDVNSATKLSALGYDMIEEYADQLADTLSSQTWSSSTGEWSTDTVNWSTATPGVYDHALIRGNGVTNGTVTVSASGATAFSLSIGGNGPASGESLFVTGGGLTVYNTVTVGDQNNALLQITGGLLNAGQVQLGNTIWDTSGNPTTFTGTLALLGGTLETDILVQGGGTPGNWTTGSVWNWSGGTLQAGATGLLVKAPATLGAGGGILDSNSSTATLSGVLSGSGSFTKIGAGVAILSASNNYSGGTIINGGAIKATNNQSVSTQAVTINTANGLQLGNGVNLANTIIANGGSSEVVDVPDTSASATLSGSISLASQSSDQYRMGVSGTSSTLTLTGASTVSTAISLITRGNIVFAQNGSLNVTGNGLEIGRFSSTSTVNLTIRDNAIVSATSIALGGLNGSSDALKTSVTLTGNGTLSAGTGTANLNNSATANNTTTLSLLGTSDLFAGSISETSTAAGHSALMFFNGGTINATANDPVAGTFWPALNAATVTILGTANINNGGFSISIVQPLLGSANDTGFTTTGAGTTTLFGANTWHGPTTVSAGTLVVGGASSLPANNVVVNNSALVIAANSTASNVSGTGTLTVGTPTNLATMQLTAGGTPSQQSSLVIGNGSALDITNNKLFINYGSGADPISSIAGYILSGYDGGAWNGSGIISTTAQANSANFGIGYADSADPGNPAGLASGQIEVMYTLLGDANLDGKVNGTDFAILATNFNQGGLPWDAGDFNYDGAVNGTDFAFLATNFSQGVGGSVSAAADETALVNFAAANGLMADVPEPCVAAMSVVAGFGLLMRRRRSR